MAVPRNAIPHLRLVFGGTTGTASAEIWACTLKLVPTTAGPPVTPMSQSAAETSILGLERADLLTAVADMTSPVQTMTTALTSTAFYLDYIKLNAYGSNDLQVTDPSVQVSFGGMQGTVPSNSPWSSCLDMYHRTTTASRGFASHGRMSIPTGLNTVQATGKLQGLGNSATIAHTLDQAATIYATFLEALPPASPFSNYYPAILYTSTTTAKPPRASVINRIIASDIPGEVRTRENALRQGSAPTTVTYS